MIPTVPSMSTNRESPSSPLQMMSSCSHMFTGCRLTMMVRSRGSPLFSFAKRDTARKWCMYVEICNNRAMFKPDGNSLSALCRLRIQACTWPSSTSIVTGNEVSYNSERMPQMKAFCHTCPKARIGRSFATCTTFVDTPPTSSSPSVILSFPFCTSMSSCIRWPLSAKGGPLSAYSRNCKILATASCSGIVKAFLNSDNVLTIDMESADLIMSSRLLKPQWFKMSILGNIKAVAIVECTTAVDACIPCCRFSPMKEWMSSNCIMSPSLTMTFSTSKPFLNKQTSPRCSTHSLSMGCISMKML
mmetsp:Transcript_122330/g.228587  ORF Transcript_122330/g.228587 Transcript_122330/m.228587 type:complete len:302 (+) Transcript_122330:606-1511(+)